MAKIDNSVTEDVEQGAVIYTDGGVRPTNPGPAGYGFHGYIYNIKKPKKGSGNPTSILTNYGYVDKSMKGELESSSGATDEPGELPTKMMEVEPVHYVDAFGAIRTHVTNNVAEIVASNSALDWLKQYKLKEIRILTDSDGVVRASNGYIERWMERGWTSSSGNPIANIDYWKTLWENINAHRGNGTTVDFQWVKGHNGDVGNERADFLATMGVTVAQAGRDDEIAHTLKAEGYWKNASERNPLLDHQIQYFNANGEKDVPSEYFVSSDFVDPEDGKASADVSAGYVQLNTPDPIISTVKEVAFAHADGIDTLIKIYLNTLFSKRVYEAIVRFGKDVIRKPKPVRINLEVYDREPVCKELSPIRIADRVIENCSVLAGINKEISGAFDPNRFQLIDISDLLFEVDAKKNVRLKTSITSATKSFDVRLAFSEFPDKEQVIPVTFGIDTLSRNALKRMETSVPKVELVVWKESERLYRYCTRVTNDTGCGLYWGVHSAIRFV